MSHLQNKSEMLKEAAALLNNKTYYPAVAHSAYYSCYQLLKHIWLYGLKKTQQELDSQCSISRIGSHEFLINEIGKHIKNSTKKTALADFREFNNKIWQLKKIRTTADYDDTLFDSSQSSNSISLSTDIIPILKKY
jgi:hypothetical protein